MKSTKNIIKTMKIIKVARRILFTGFILLTLVFVALHIWVNIKGKALLAKKLEDTFNQKISIGTLNTSFPAYLHVRNIEAKGLFKIEEIVVGGGLFDIFRQSFKLSVLKVIHPEVTIEKGLIQSTAGSLISPAEKDLQNRTDNKNLAPNPSPIAATKGKFLSLGFYIGRLIVEDGTLNLIDKTVGNNGISIKIVRLNLKVDNLNLHTILSQIISFQLKGRIPWQEGQEEGKIEAEGWLNFFKKDMQATLKINDIDGLYLHPYYSNWVDLEKARIEKAKLNFSSDIHGLNNNVTAQCHLELTDIVRKPRQPEESGDKAEKITDAVLGIFKALNQGKIVLDFTIRTKMDRPEFGFGNIKMAFEDKLAEGKKANGFKAEDIFVLPGKLLGGTAKGLTDFSKALIIGTVNAGIEVKKAVEGAFKKEPQPQPQQQEEVKKE